MAERLAQKSLLARKGEARPAESETADDSLLSLPEDTSREGAGGAGLSEEGFFLLRSKDPELDRGTAEAHLSLDASPADELRSDAEAPSLEAEMPDKEMVESYAPPSDSEGPFDKAAAGSLLDFRLIRARERRVCPVNSDAEPSPHDGPKVQIPSLGTCNSPSRDAPRRAASKPLQSPASLPQPLPLKRQGDEAGAQTLNQRQTRAKLDTATPAADASVAASHSKPSLPSTPQMPSTIAASSETAELPLAEAAAIPQAAAVASSSQPDAFARAKGHAWKALRALPAILGGTPHLAYLAGLLILCALGGIWFILADNVPVQQSAPQIAESQNVASPSDESLAATQTETKMAAVGETPQAPSDDLSLGALKAAPMLSGDEADAATDTLSGAAPLETQAGPTTATAQDAPAGGTAPDTASSDTAAAGTTATNEPTANDEVTAANAESLGTLTADTETGTETAMAVDQGAYSVQLFAARDQESAARALGSMTEKLAKVLDGHALRIVETKSNSGRAMYRVRREGFAESETANNFCNELKKAGQDCLVLRRQ